LPTKTIFLITGFLGSGKTTLLLNLLPQFMDTGSKIGVIMNEFGDINIDGQLLPQISDIEVIEINNGSIFCSCLHSNFIESLLAFTRTDVNLLLIEASGLSDSSSMIKDLEMVNKLVGEIYIFGGNICIIDSKNFLNLIEILQIMERQVQACSLVLVNKVDTVNRSMISRIKEKIQKINSNLYTIETSYCDISLQKLLPGINFSKEEHIKPIKCINTPNSKNLTKTLISEKRISLKEVESFFKGISKNLRRVKGIFQTKDGWYIINGINHVFEFNRTTIAPPTTQIVLIFKIGVLKDVVEEIDSKWKQIFAS
jgi:G3E family GTPase